jgi:hypothetical protein
VSFAGAGFVNLRHFLFKDVNDPDLLFTTSLVAAVQLHRTGRWCILQQSRVIDYGTWDFAVTRRLRLNDGYEVTRGEPRLAQHELPIPTCVIHALFRQIMGDMPRKFIQMPRLCGLCAPRVR